MTRLRSWLGGTVPVRRALLYGWALLVVSVFGWVPSALAEAVFWAAVALLVWSWGVSRAERRS